METMYANRGSIARRAATTLITIVTCGTLLGVFATDTGAQDISHRTAYLAGTFWAAAPGEAGKDSGAGDRNGEIGGFRHSCAWATARCDGELQVRLTGVIRPRSG